MLNINKENSIDCNKLNIFKHTSNQFLVMQPVPSLNSQEIEKGFQLAENSSRKRHSLIVHQKGDYFNKVFNFLLNGTYMKPHRHVGLEKIEK